MECYIYLRNVTDLLSDSSVCLGVPCGAAYKRFFSSSWSRACGKGRNLTQLVPSVFFAQMLLFQSSAAPRVLWHEFPTPINFDAFPVEKIGVGGVGGVGELVAG